MFIKTKKWLWLTVLILGPAVAGCTHSGGEMMDWQSEMDQKDMQIEELTMENRSMEGQIEDYQNKLENQMMQTQAAEQRAMESGKMAATMTTDIPLLPPDAMPGQCFARVFVPPKYQTVSEQVLREGASERIEIVPAKYEMVEEEVLVREASNRMETVPAKYDWVEEEVQVKAAHTTWKKGRGLIEKVDNTTGEIMCLVEMPAEYKTVKSKVMIKPPESTIINIPAEYNMVKVRRMVSPPQKQVIKVPAQYQTINKTIQVSDGSMEWRNVLCETNMTKDNIMKIQASLNENGHNPGPIDGIVGKRTMAAVTAYQKEQNLATGALTYRTIESLKVNLAE